MLGVLLGEKLLIVGKHGSNRNIFHIDSFNFDETQNFVLLKFSLAPDYILCSKETESRLVPAIIRAWREFFTETPSTSYSYGRIVNERHFERIRNLLDSKKIIYGGDIDPSTNYISPTIM